MLDKAYVLPDGRRVFKSEDGERVYDEYGMEVGRDVIDPAMIPDHVQRWEGYQDVRGDIRLLRNQQTKLIDDQNKVDDAKEKVAKGNLTTDELDALESDVEKAMPIFARRFVATSVEKYVQHVAPQISSVFNGKADPPGPVPRPRSRTGYEAPSPM